MKQLSKEDRLQLMKFVCSFAWADLRIEQAEREMVHKLVRKLKLGPDSIWLMHGKIAMNGSGLAVEQGCRSLGIEARDVLLAYDEVDLPLGQLRLRRNGGSGGHRGVESVLQEMGTASIPRLRLGVRGVGRSRDTAGYVLGDFDADEIEVLEDMLDRAVGAVRMIVRRGMGVAMNTYNQRAEQPRPSIEPASGTSPDECMSSDKEHRE